MVETEKAEIKYAILELSDQETIEEFKYIDSVKCNFDFSKLTKFFLSFSFNFSFNLKHSRFALHIF